MTPAEAIALQQQKPQLPIGWRGKPVAPAKPQDAPRVSHESALCFSRNHTTALRKALARLADKGPHLPYSVELAEEAGIHFESLAQCWRELEEMGDIKMLVGPQGRSGVPTERAVRLMSSGHVLRTRKWPEAIEP